MSKCYKKPFLKKVIIKIEFTANYELPQKGLTKTISNEILKLFPIPEPKEILAKHVHISDGGIEQIENKQNHLFFHGRSRDKTLCITPEFLYIEIINYETYDKLKEEFITIIDKLFEKENFSVKRFGLRYVNDVKSDNESPLDWGEYLNSDLLNMFNIPENKELLSRAFSNIVQQFDDSMLLNFQYGMHNPDFPSRIKQNMFILDFDAFYQGLISYGEVKEYIDVAHERIENLYERSIKPPLRVLMKEELNE